MMLISEAAAALNVAFNGPDALITSVGADSRKIVPGQLFVALKGDKFNGHDFALAAIQQGATAVLVCQPVANVSPAIVVEDTYKALGHLAAYWRSKFCMPIAGITGSSGKTTVKEMLASILRTSTSAEAVLATQGNLNNHIGLPMTLLKLSAQHRYAVIEMGMNHSGEIAYLTGLTKPNVALVNNAGSAHLGELGSIEAIARAKGEIFSGLADDGIAVINGDDVFAPLWRTLIGSRKTISFGLEKPADVTAAYTLQADGSILEIQTPKGNCRVDLPAPGLHNVMNALAASSAALAMGIEIHAIANGLENYSGVKGRLQSLPGLNQALVIDDTYNANPISMRAAIDVLRGKSGKKILVLGDMGELGEDALALHAEIGEYAKASNVNALYTLGNHSQAMSQAFGEGAQHYAKVEDLTVDLAKEMQPGSTVLVKGSRFMAMERVVKEIVIPNIAEKNNGGEH